MNSDMINDMARKFCEAFYSGCFEGDPGFAIDSLTLDEAYRIQDEVIRLREARGERIVGYKVGCTSEAIRDQLGLKEPINGRIMSPHVYRGPTTLNRQGYVNCAIEPEMVLCIQRDLTGERVETDYLVDAIEYVSPGIEVHHFKFWYDPPTSQELIASNGIHACQIVGTSRARPGDLNFETEVFRVFENNDLIAEGISPQIMGGPIHSLRWLISHLAKRGQTLKAGQLVIPGSPAELIQIDRDTKLRIEISGVGQALVEFTSGNA
jgi:2-keto-4-pentenoate hydratase